MMKTGKDRITDLKNKLEYIDRIAKVNIENLNNDIYTLYFYDINSFFTDEGINKKIRKKEEQLENYINFIKNEKQRILNLIKAEKQSYQKLNNHEIRLLKIHFIKNLRRRKLRFRSVYNINKLPELPEIIE